MNYIGGNGSLGEGIRDENKAKVNLGSADKKNVSQARSPAPSESGKEK